MPEIVPTRELSVGEVSQIQHRRNVIIISILALVFIGAFFISIRDLSPTFAVGVIFMLGFFLISFINIRLGFVLVILAFLLSPEINLPMSKFRDFTVRTEDFLIIVLLLAWLGRLAMGLQKHFLISTPLNSPIFLIIAWNIICSFRAITLGWVDTNFCILTNLKLIEFFVIFFLIVNNLNDIKEVKFMLYILLFVALVIGIYTALQIPKTQMFSSRRLTAPFEGTPEPNTLGAYLAIFFGAALSIFIYAEKSPMRNICAVLVILLPFPIMFSFARSAYIAAIVMILAIAIISKRKWVFWTLIVFLLLSPFIVPNPVISRAFYNFQDRRYFGYFDPSAAERITVYKKLWDNLKFQPIFGQGVAWGGGILDSQYARVGIETGVPGLLLFFWLIIRLLKMGISLFKSSEGWIKGMALGFIVVVIGVIVHGIGNITLFIVRIAEPFWGLVALVAFTYYISLQKPALSNDFKGNVK